MKISHLRTALALALSLTICDPGHSMPKPASLMEISDIRTIAGKTCKQVDSCDEAVRLWCGGYRRADADNDGIPCETICHSNQQVDEIRKQIDC